MPKAYLVGSGSYLPEKILSNHDLQQMVDTTDEWITSRTGIKERRIAAPDEFPSDMGAAAAIKALQSADLAPEAIDMILVATMTPDYISPSTAALIQHKIGAKRAAAMDIQAACSGYLYALSIAKAYVESSIYKHVLVVSTEKMSAFLDYRDRSTCVLFGDGASASIVSSTCTGLAMKLTSIQLGTDGSLPDLIMIPGGGARHPATELTVSQGLHYFQMSGKEVFKHAVKLMDAAARSCLNAADLNLEQIRWVVPHQANLRIMEALAKKFDLSNERMYKTIHKYGNTSAASIPIALDDLFQNHALSPGEHILLVTVGGGLTWGAALLTKGQIEHAEI
jgi:3-oxoacyl-[acyl-carrier-protein] synthase III